MAICADQRDVRVPPGMHFTASGPQSLRRLPLQLPVAQSPEQVRLPLIHGAASSPGPSPAQNCLHEA